MRPVGDYRDRRVARLHQAEEIALFSLVLTQRSSFPPRIQSFFPPPLLSFRFVTRANRKLDTNWNSASGGVTATRRFSKLHHLCQPALLPPQIRLPSSCHPGEDHNRGQCLGGGAAILFFLFFLRKRYEIESRKSHSRTRRNRIIRSDDAYECSRAIRCMHHTAIQPTYLIQDLT